jgi:carbon storage regulator CsrA
MSIPFRTIQKQYKERIAMLLLSVKEGDYIMIGDDIKVKIIGGSNVSKLGIDAPKHVPIKRQAVYERENDIAPDQGIATVEDL